MEVKEDTIDAGTLVKCINDAASRARSIFNEKEQAELLASCEKLERSLESPREATQRIIFAAYHTSFHRASKPLHGHLLTLATIRKVTKLWLWDWP